MFSRTFWVVAHRTTLLVRQVIKIIKRTVMLLQEHWQVGMVSTGYYFAVESSFDFLTSIGYFLKLYTDACIHVVLRVFVNVVWCQSWIWKGLKGFFTSKILITALIKGSIILSRVDTFIASSITAMLTVSLSFLGYRLLGSEIVSGGWCGGSLDHLDDRTILLT
jgi:hypothetical protein